MLFKDFHAAYEPCHVLLSGIFARIVRDWIYIMFCEYMNSMFRSERLKDAKFKSLVANDQTDWCLKDRKAESARLHSLTLTVILSDNGSDNDESAE